MSWHVWSGRGPLPYQWTSTYCCAPRVRGAVGAAAASLIWCQAAVRALPS
jgi:hypothetical protein